MRVRPATVARARKLRRDYWRRISVSWRLERNRQKLMLDFNGSRGSFGWPPFPNYRPGSYLERVSVTWPGHPLKRSVDRAS